MPETMTTYEHVQLDAKGVPIIVGTNMKVVELLMAQLAHGWSPEEIHFQHPYLSLGQIHSALAYYWDHKAELDEDIEHRPSTLKKNAAKQAPFRLQPNFASKGSLRDSRAIHGSACLHPTRAARVGTPLHRA